MDIKTTGNVDEVVRLVADLRTLRSKCRKIGLGFDGLLNYVKALEHDETKTQNAYDTLCPSGWHG